MKKTRTIASRHDTPGKRPAGKASDYIKPLEVRPGDKFYLCCRVSEHTQYRNGNLDDLVASLRRSVERSGGQVVGVIKHVGPGWDPSWLAVHATRARELGATLLAETTDRFVRSPFFHSRSSPSAQAREVDLERLRVVTGGVPLMTVADPDATPGEVRSQQTKRGQGAKHNKGGRPPKREPGYKRRRRQELLLRVLQLRNLRLSLSVIADVTGLPRSTVQDWIARYSRGGVRFLGFGRG